MISKMFFYIISTIILPNLIAWSRGSSDNVLWGVPPNEIHLYKPGKEFTCKDKNSKIPYDKVNDNYCDCADGSDEPSTSACAHGVFYCLNKGYLGHMIPSNRVNDGVCDCCDGTDEYASNICEDKCSQLEENRGGKEANEDSSDPEYEDDIDEEDTTPHQRYMVHMGTRKQQEKLERLRKLEFEKTAVEDDLKRMEKLTNVAETKANEALGKLNEDNSVEDLNEDKSVEDKYAQDAFESLDLNKDGILELEEVKKEEIFDLNKNMVIEDKEIKWYYDAMPGIANEDLFRKKMWRKMGRLYVLEKKLDEAVQFEFKYGNHNNIFTESEKHFGSEKKESTSKTRKNREDEDVVEVDDEDYDFMGNGMDDLDDKTKTVVKEAMDARKKLNDMKRKLKEVKRQKREVEDTLFDPDPDADDNNEGIVEHLDNFGPNERSKYFPLRMHCFKYNDKYFLYRMCPFFGCTQTPKDKDNKETIDLGKWVGWSKEDGEPIMVFKKGDYCDDGVRRSATVRIYCGARNLLVHVEETRKCKYRMEFKSPAGCHLRNLKEANFTFTSHDEL